MRPPSQVNGSLSGQSCDDASGNWRCRLLRGHDGVHRYRRTTPDLVSQPSGRGPYIWIGRGMLPTTDCPVGCSCDLCRDWPWVTQ